VRMLRTVDAITSPDSPRSATTNLHG
jgi:hypothetical protein